MPAARIRHIYEEFDGSHANLNQQRRLRTLEWFTATLPSPKRSTNTSPRRSKR